MWDTYDSALIVYGNVCIEEWLRRGYNNNMPIWTPENIELPWWFGVDKFHNSHKAALLAKKYDWYKQFNWKIEPKIEYWWPVNGKSRS
jgi:hypothetical protein